MTITEFGIDVNLELKDTVSVVKVYLKNLDIDALVSHPVGKSTTRYNLTINANETKMSYRSPTLGEMGTGYEMIFDCSQEPNLTTRMIKALKHGYCLSGGTTMKEKF